MPDDGDLLLYSVSAFGDVPWRRFKETVDEIYLRRARLRPRSQLQPPDRPLVVRALSALGHCEFDFGGGRVYSASPVLARLPAPGLPSAVLCGARVPGTTDRLKEARAKVGQEIKLELKSQGGGADLAPTLIRIEAESMHALQELAGRAAIPCPELPPAWAIATASGSLDGYLSTLAWSAEDEVDWPRSDFDPAGLHFGGRLTDDQPLRLSRYQDPVRRQWMFRLCERQLSVEVDPDWGRFAVLRSVGRKILRYDARIGVLGVPIGVPLPRLLARAVALCSGLAPKLSNDGDQSADGHGPGVQMFANVPYGYFAIVAAKLGQVLESSQIERGGTP